MCFETGHTAAVLRHDLFDLAGTRSLPVRFSQMKFSRYIKLIFSLPYVLLGNPFGDKALFVNDR